MNIVRVFKKPFVFLCSVVIARPHQLVITSKLNVSRLCQVYLTFFNRWKLPIPVSCSENLKVQKERLTHIRSGLKRWFKEIKGI